MTSHIKDSAHQRLQRLTRPTVERPLGRSWLPSQGAHAISEAVLSRTAAFAFEGERSTPAAGERYQRISLLGEGGMGRVWFGWDSALERNVAIKEPLADASSAQAQQLTYEAMITARLEHPAIVSVHDVFHEQGRPHFVMRLVCGQPLATLIDAHHAASPGELPSALVRHVLVACEALGYAHRAGVVHRDISPMNVLVSEDHSAHVIDWGLAAHIADLPERLGYIGTPGYVAPEQRLGASASERSDVWSLGALIYDVLHGCAFDEDAPIVSGSHPQLRAIMHCAMSHDPDERYADGVEMAEDLQRWFEGQRVRAYATTPWEEVRRLSHTYRRHIVLALTLSLAFAVAIAAGVVRTRQQADRARAAEATALAREADTRREATRTRQLAARLLHHNATAHAKSHDLFVAEHLAVQSLQSHDNPQARGLLSALAAHDHPTSRRLFTLPECEHNWMLTDSPEIALCGVFDPARQLSQVKAWSNGAWLWTHTMDNDSHYACGLATLKSVGDEVLIEAHPHKACKGDVWIHDLHDGSLLREDATKGLSVYGGNFHRVTEDASFMLDYPATRGVCEGAVALIEEDAEGTIWFVCEQHKVFRLDQQGVPLQVPVPAQDQVTTLTHDEQGKVWMGTALGNVFSLDDSRTSWTIEEPVESLLMIPGTSLMAVRSRRGKVRILDTQQRAWVITLPERCLDMKAGEGGMLRVLHHNNNVVEWHFPARAQIGQYRGSAGISALAWSRDGDRVAAIDGSGSVHLFEPEQGKTWAPHTSFRGAGKWIAAASTFDGFMMIAMFSGGVQRMHLDQDEMRFAPVEELSSITVARRLMLSPHDDVLALVYDHSVFVKYAHEEEPRKILANDGGFAHDSDVSADNAKVLIISDVNAMLWDWQGDPVRVHAHADTLMAGSVNVGGEVVLAERAALLIFDASLQQTRRIHTGEGTILDVEWVPGRPWVVSAHFDGSVKIWDVERGALLASSVQHNERVAKVAISPDGRWLATGGWDGFVVVWDLLLVDEPLATLQQRLLPLSSSRLSSLEE